MALKVSSANISKVMHHAQGLQSRVAKMREKSQEKIATAIHSGLSAGTAFGIGVLNGRHGGPVEIVGAPLELVVGVGGHALGLLGFGGKFQGVMHGVADGALASYAYMMGRGVGANWAAKSGGPALRGNLDLPSDRLTPEERAKIEEPVRAQR